MFGTKQGKQERTVKLLTLLRERGEMTSGQLAQALNVSADAIEDDLLTLHDDNVPVCQKGRKLSLLEHWFGKK